MHDCNLFESWQTLNIDRCHHYDRVFGHCKHQKRVTLVCPYKGKDVPEINREIEEERRKSKMMSSGVLEFDFAHNH